MKVRKYFVTNSSSSSFIISKKYLDDDQIETIRKHYFLGKKMGLVNDKWDYPYHIEENEDFITGYVEMDNFSMASFLEKIEVNDRDIVWGEYPFNLQVQTDMIEDITQDLDWRKLLHEN